MTIQRRTLHLLASGVLLLLLAWALPGRNAPPVGAEATVLGAASSLWEDGDLRFGPEDVARVESQWHGDVRGLSLLRSEAPAGDGEPTSPFVFARPVLYPAVAAPAYGLLGPRGLRVLNAALFFAVFWAAWRLLGHPKGCRRLPRSGLTLGAFFFASAALAHMLAFTSTAFETAALFFSLALWCRVRERPLWGLREVGPLAIAGGLAACAFGCRPALGLFVVPPVVDLLWSRRWKGAAAFVLAAGLAAAGLWNVQEGVTGPVSWDWDLGLAERAQTFDGPLPFQVGGPAPDAPGAPSTDSGGSPDAGPRLVHDVWSLLVGRHVGLVPYFPFAVFALGLYLVDLRRSGGRTRHLLAGTLLVYGLLLALHLPEAARFPAAPGLAAVAAVYPVFLFLPWRLRAGSAVLLPFAAAGLWTVPAVLGSFHAPVPAAAFELHARSPAFRPLPLELTLLAADRLPGYGLYERPARHGMGVWRVPRENAFLQEDNPRGIWFRGASRSEIYGTTAPDDGQPPELRLRLGSLSAENTVTVVGADERVIVRFDSPAKRRGTPIAIRPEPVGWTHENGERERLWRLTLETSHGAIPARINPANGDGRYLGVFVGLGW